LLSQISSRHGYAGHYRDEIAQHGNRRDHVARLQIAKMAGAVLALRWRRNARHVLRHDVSGFESAYKERTHIANQRRDPIAFRQGIGCAYRSSFLSQASVQATDDFVLPEKTNQEFIERAIEPHKVVELERFLAFQFRARRVGFHELPSYRPILKVAAALIIGPRRDHPLILLRARLRLTSGAIPRDPQAPVPTQRYC